MAWLYSTNCHAILPDIFEKLRNLQVLGKLLIAREEPKCEAGQSRRGRNAA